MDIRQFIDKCEREGELLRIKAEVDWNLEIGSISKLNEERNGPALLFEKVKGYRTPVLTGVFGNTRKFAIALGMPLEYTMSQMARQWMNQALQKPVVAREVTSGPVMENVIEGTGVNLLDFPVPKFFPLDGGRYIGTTASFVCRDPESGRVTLGTYRMQVLDEKSIGVGMNIGKLGEQMVRKYRAMGRKMPVAVAIGCDPLLLFTGSSMNKSGSDYDAASTIRGEPMDIFTSDLTGLPIPASAEIVIEGEIDPAAYRPEGPFGEYTGYYTEETEHEVPKPCISVKRVMHRNHPILWTSAAGGRPVTDVHMILSFMRTATLWTELEQMKIPGIKSVYIPPEGGGTFWIIVSVKQKYPGHANHILEAVLGTNTGAYGTKGVIVVDDDIAADDLARVWWALSVRYMPARGTQIVDRGRPMQLDPALDPRESRLITSRILMDATLPYEWEVKPKEIRLPEEVAERVRRRWKEYGFGRELSEEN